MPRLRRPVEDAFRFRRGVCRSCKCLNSMQLRARTSAKVVAGSSVRARSAEIGSQPAANQEVTIARVGRPAPLEGDCDSSAVLLRLLKRSCLSEDLRRSKAIATRKKKNTTRARIMPSEDLRRSKAIATKDSSVVGRFKSAVGRPAPLEGDCDNQCRGR